MATGKKPIPLLVRAKETTPPSEMTGGRLIDGLASLTDISDDLMFVLMRPSDGMSYRGTFVDLKSAVLSKEYGIMQTVDGDTTSPVATQTVTATPEYLLTWNVNGLASGVSPDYTTGVISAAKAGIYEIDVSISFSGSLSKTFVFEIYYHDVTASPIDSPTGFRMVRKLGASGDVGSASLSGLVSLTAGQGVSLHVSSTDGGSTITVFQAQMKVSQI